MRIRDHLTAGRVVLLESEGKAQALDRLVRLLADATPGVERGELARAVMRRESLMSTGIGQGLAVPHVRMAGFREVTMAVGVSRKGIVDYESLDGEPVRIILLIGAPAGQHEAYIRLLALVTETLKDAKLREAILASRTPEGIYSLLTREETP
ncbi:MAG: PTS sugar transporter subunit IIA [Phycisphaerae bacterium]